MAEIQLNGYTVRLDDEDYERLGGERWHVTASKTTAGKRYVYAGRFESATKKMTLMHRVITGAPKGLVVDHINGDTLDNRRGNLRVCTASENLKNKVSIHVPKPDSPPFLPKIACRRERVKKPRQITTRQIAVRELTGKLLSDRECQVIEMLADGINPKGIARELGLGQTTVSTFVMRLKRKLGVQTAVEAANLYYSLSTNAATSPLPPRFTGPCLPRTRPAFYSGQR